MKYERRRFSIRWTSERTTLVLHWPWREAYLPMGHECVFSLLCVVIYRRVG